MAVPQPTQTRRRPIFPPLHKVFSPSDFTISTWLLFGATLQCFLFMVLPKNVAIVPPISLLLFRFIRSQLQAAGYIRNPLADGVNHSLTTAQFPAPDGTLTAPRSSESITVLVLTASISHPNGSFSPGVMEIGKYFKKMWRDANAQREKYGYLGNTPALVAQEDKLGGEYGPRNGDDKGKTLMWMSYWKTLDGLHGFAHAEAHRAGRLWWERGAGEKYKHIGIAHEVYEVPAGNWENIYHNFRPFGITNAKFPVKVEGKDGEQGEVKWVSGLKRSEGKDWKNMEARMGRPPGSIGLKNLKK